MIISAIKFYLKKSMILFALVFQYVGWGGAFQHTKRKKKNIKQSRDYDVYAGECFEANG